MTRPLHTPRSTTPTMSLLVRLALAASTPVPAHAGEVKLPPPREVSGALPAAVRDELLSVIGGSWRAYVARDAKAFARYLHPAVRRLSQRSSGATTGRDAALAGLADEWRAFEKSEDSVRTTWSLAVREPGPRSPESLRGA